MVCDLDEGHLVKNHTIARGKAVREIPVVNGHRIILSGTPLQNNLVELWSLLDFTSEGKLFGTVKEFNREWAKPIDAGRQKDATVVEKELSDRLMKQIRECIKPFMLARTKKQVRAGTVIQYTYTSISKLHQSKRY